MLDPTIGSRPKVFTTIGERGMLLSSHKDVCNALPPTTTMRFLACHDVIESVLPVLEQILTIRDTVNMSMTCHGLRNEMVDQSTNETKISHFDTTPERLAEMLHNGNSARSTSVFIQNALTRIHFPSLLSLDVDLSSTVRQPSILQGIFSCLISKIALATKLRKLRLEALELLTLPTEMDIVMKPTIEAFGKNLEECCPDLVELNISIGSWAWLYRRNPIGDFVRMLRGVVFKKRGTLENLSFSWEFEFDEEEDLDSADDVICLLSSIFELERLHSLSLDLRCPFMSEMLLRAFKSNGTKEESLDLASLQSLQISIEEDHDEFAFECSHAPLLDYIDRFTEIKQLKLSLPRRCFQDSRSLFAWKRFIISQQHITHLMLGFDSFSDEDDWIVEVLASSLKKLTSLVYFQCCSLMNVNRKLLIEVINNLLRERRHRLNEISITEKNGRKRILMEDLLVAGPKRVDCNVLTSETPSNFK